MIILDTNVLSELARPAPDRRVVDWTADRRPDGLFTTSITMAELLYGIERLPAGRRRSGLLATAEQMFDEDFAGRILTFDESAARAYAGIAAGRQAAGLPTSQADAMIAAIARSQGASLATRNLRDFEGCGVPLIDPWNPGSQERPTR